MNANIKKEAQENETLNLKIFIDGLKKSHFHLIEFFKSGLLKRKKMNIKYHVKERIFLNLDLDMPAYAIAIVEDTSEQQGTSDGDFYYGDISLSLSDCYRRVTYDFNLSTREGRKEALYKARRIAKIVNAFREALEKEVKLIESLQRSKAKQTKSAAA